MQQGELFVKTFLYKYIHLIICTLLLITFGIYGYIHTEYAESISIVPLSFTVESNGNSVDISLYQADDTHYYVFLPSYAKMDYVTINMSSKGNISIDDISLSPGMNCQPFSTGKEYRFKVNNRENLIIQFCQSANIATMYINTATGSMTRVHNDKEYKQPSSMLLITEDGITACYDNSASIKGRGNSTWNEDKKPYLLKLSSSEALLGMSPSTDWVLLANSLDATNLRNKLIYDFANQTILTWTPKGEFVDVYLNGSYNGLYLLSERIETNAEQLGIDTLQGDFVCKVDLADRWDVMRHPFIGDLSGRELEITIPEKLTPQEEQRIHSLVRNMEQSILFSPEKDSLSYLDIESWVCKYLIDEIFANGDADLTSSYFYYTNNTFYAGPLWDYDNTLGSSIRNRNPRAFTAKNYRKAPYFDSDYYYSLYKNDLFFNRICEMYKNDLLPMLDTLISTDIPNLAKQIESASTMNYLRWRTMYDSSSSTVTTVDSLISYMEERILFLNDAWINNIDYCTVQFEADSGGSYFNVSVIRGLYLDNSYPDLENVVWLNADTGQIFDIAQPITEDISLVQQSRK